MYQHVLSKTQELGDITKTKVKEKKDELYKIMSEAVLKYLENSLGGEYIKHIKEEEFKDPEEFYHHIMNLYDTIHPEIDERGSQQLRGLIESYANSDRTIGELLVELQHRTAMIKESAVAGIKRDYISKEISKHHPVALTKIIKENYLPKAGGKITDPLTFYRTIHQNPIEAYSLWKGLTKDEWSRRPEGIGIKIDRKEGEKKIIEEHEKKKKAT